MITKNSAEITILGEMGPTANQTVLDILDAVEHLSRYNPEIRKRVMAALTE